MLIGSLTMLAPGEFPHKSRLRRGPMTQGSSGCQIELELTLQEHYETC